MNNSVNMYQLLALIGLTLNYGLWSHHAQNKNAHQIQIHSLTLEKPTKIVITQTIAAVCLTAEEFCYRAKRKPL